jgi:16S rRNA (guanine966-N2)-methyltransferase
VAARNRPSVRIIAGRWKGRRLVVPEGTRPTSDRAREALFSILQKRIPGAAVLDVYAGSGAVGLEAISRGAARAVLIERSGASALGENLQRLPPPHDSVEILGEDATAALESLSRAGRRFDLVFADPPYGSRTTALERRAAELLAPGGVLVLQRDRGEGEPALLPDLHLISTRDYGRNVFSFYASEPQARPNRPPAL